MNELKSKLESRIVSTLKMNPDLTWTQATDLTLRTLGVHSALPSRTTDFRRQRSAMAKQRIEPQAEE